MQNDLSNYRKSYQKDELLEEKLPETPLLLFQKWFRDADAVDAIEETNAMTLSTIGLDGYPKNRVVLLKKFTSEGFIFYTNYQSEKGKAIATNPNVGLSFFWSAVERQVIIKGTAEKTSEEISDRYFASRPIGSKLGAIVSNQSQVISSRAVLEEKLNTLELFYKNKDIPRPKYWGGYLVRPHAMTFWQGRPNRLHDSILYTLQKDSSWKKERLAP